MAEQAPLAAISPSKSVSPPRSPPIPTPSEYHSTVLKKSTPLSVAVSNLLFQMWLLEGNICSTKTTTGKKIGELCEKNNIAYEFFKEEMDPVLIANFYKNPPAFGFAVQIYAMERCNSVQLRAHSAAKAGKLSIGDRGMDGNEVFKDVNEHRGNIIKEQAAAYNSVRMSHQPVEVAGVLYLDVSPELAFTRHHDRLAADPQKSESSLTLDYLEDVDRFYCRRMINSLAQGSSNLLVLEDKNTWVNPEHAVRSMAHFSRHYSDYGVVPGKDLVVKRWDEYGCIVDLGERERRKLMTELSKAQFAEMRSARLSDSSAA